MALASGTQTRHIFTHDAKLIFTAVLNTSGNAVERYRYTPYGKLTVLDSDFTPDTDSRRDTENDYTFPGRRRDAETGLFYFRNRYYAAEVGRFVSRDPLAYADGAVLVHRELEFMTRSVRDKSVSFWV